MSLRLRFVVVRRVFSLQYPILTLLSLLQIPKMVVFPIDKEPLVCGRVVSEWGFFRLTRCPLPPSAIRARFGCWGLFISLCPFPLVKTELKAEWKREQQKEIIVRFKRELKPDNSLVSIWKPFIPSPGGRG